MDQPTVEIVEALPDELRSQAADVYWHAFSQKYRALLPGKELAIRLLARVFNTQQAIIAVQEGHCIGIAGLHYSGRTFVSTPLTIFREELGLLRGTIGVWSFHAFEPHPADDEVRIECLAVAPEARGKGVGTRLLAAVYDSAKKHGFDKVCLEVVDTNPEARRLYVREGFVCVKTDHLPIMHLFAGYAAQDVMVKQLS